MKLTRLTASAAASLMAVAVAVAIPMLAACDGSGMTLELMNEETGNVIAQFALSPGERFQIHFTHSFDGTPVVEVYSAWPDGRLIVEEVTYNWLGSGLETHPEQGTYVFENGWVGITDMNRSLESFVLRVGSVAGHRLVVGSESVPLTELVPPFTPVRFRVRSP